MANQVAAKGYYKASLLGASGSPEIIVYSDGESYFSFESSTPAKPLDPSDFIVDAVPLYPTSSGEQLKTALWQAREFIIKTANEYKREKVLTINNSLEGGKLISVIDEVLGID